MDEEKHKKLYNHGNLNIILKLKLLFTINKTTHIY